MIRKFENKDTEQIMKIWLEGNIEAHDFVPRDYWASNYTKMKNQLYQAEIYVYEQDGRVAGFAGMTGDYLAGIFVDGQYRCKKIGKQLLDHIKKRHSSFSLNVYQKNRRAVSFYLREGLFIVSNGTDCDTSQADYTMKWEQSRNQNR